MGEGFVLDFNRGDILESLHEIKLEGNEDKAKQAEEYIDLVIESDEIPEEVINFLDSLSDYAKDFYMRLDSKKFFKNFKRFDEIDDIEKAKALSSLITHALIDVDMGNANVNKVRDDLNLLDMLYYLEMYLKSGNFPKECISEVESIVDEINQLEVLEVD